MVVKLSFDERKWLLLLESGESVLSSVTLGGWIWYTITNKSNNNKNPKQSGTRCIERSVRNKVKRMCYGVPASISRFNLSRLLPLGNFKEHGVRHKTINTGRTERSDWTWHHGYSISNNPDGMSLCSTSLLGVYCGRRWTFWTCTGLRKFKE